MKLSLFEGIWKWHHKGNSYFVPGGMRVFTVSQWHCPGYHFHRFGIILGRPQLPSQMFELYSLLLPLWHCTETMQVWKMVPRQKWTNSLCLLVMRNTNGSRKCKLVCFAWVSGIVCCHQVKDFTFLLALWVTAVPLALYFSESTPSSAAFNSAVMPALPRPIV